MMTTLDGFPVPVGVAGPKRGAVVVIVADAHRSPIAYDALCARLHTAALRTVVISLDKRLTPKSVIGVLDLLEVTCALVVGDRAGGDLAWELAATKLGRFSGLVVIDSGHPRVPNVKGVVRDEHCPPVEVDTTALISTAAWRTVAQQSQRYVYSEYRMVELLGRRNAQEATAQVAAEIVLRAASTW